MALENVSLEEMEGLATISHTLANNPATRKEYLRLIKQASPATSIPELDLEERVAEGNRPLLEKINSLEKELSEKNFKDLRDREHGRLREMGIPQEEIKAVEDMMLESKIGSYETAGQFYLSQKKMAEPSATQFKTAMTMPDMKEIGSDVNSWARSQAFDAINDIIKARK